MKQNIKGARGAQGLPGARGARWFTVPENSFDYSTTNVTSQIPIGAIIEVQSGIIQNPDIQVGDKVKMLVLGYTAEVVHITSQQIVVKYDGGNIRGEQGARGAQGAAGAAGAAGADGMSIDYLGDWAAGNNYIVGDVVVYYYKMGKTVNGSWATNNLYEYICIADNTSSTGDFKEYQTKAFGGTEATKVMQLDKTKWKLSRKQSNTLRGIKPALQI